MLQELGLLIQVKAVVPMSRADIDMAVQSHIDLVTANCAKGTNGKAPIRTKHLYLEIQLKMTSLLAKLVRIGVLECGEWDTYPKPRRSARINNNKH